MDSIFKGGIGIREFILNVNPNPFNPELSLYFARGVCKFTRVSYISYTYTYKFMESILFKHYSLQFNTAQQHASFWSKKKGRIAFIMLLLFV